MMVMVVVVMVVPARPNHDDGRAAIGVMMMVMVVMANADNDLGQLDIRVRRLGRSGFVDGLQNFGGVRDRFEQVGE
jgi:hypothetical protein